MAYDFKKSWYYFGCHGSIGHYTFKEGGMVKVYTPESCPFNQLDAALPLKSDRTPYVATFKRLPSLNMTALAFWDYSVDTRPGSNSAVFAPGMDITPEELLAQAEHRFPEVFNRLPQKVDYHPSMMT